MVLWYWYCIFALVNKIFSLSHVQASRFTTVHVIKCLYVSMYSVHVCIYVRYRPRCGETIFPAPRRRQFDGGINRGGSTSVRGRVRSPHISGARRWDTMASAPIAQAAAPWDRQTVPRVLPTRWCRKPAGIDLERNYVTVTLCIKVLTYLVTY